MDISVSCICRLLLIDAVLGQLLRLVSGSVLKMCKAEISLKDAKAGSALSVSERHGGGSDVWTFVYMVIGYAALNGFSLLCTMYVVHDVRCARCTW